MDYQNEKNYFDVYEELPAKGFSYVLVQSKATGDAFLYTKKNDVTEEILHSKLDSGTLLELKKGNDKIAYLCIEETGRPVFWLNLKKAEIAPFSLPADPA